MHADYMSSNSLGLLKPKVLKSQQGSVYFERGAHVTRCACPERASERASERERERESERERARAGASPVGTQPLKSGVITRSTTAEGRFDPLFAPALAIMQPPPTHGGGTGVTRN